MTKILLACSLFALAANGALASPSGPAAPLNDTGQTTCYAGDDAGAELTACSDGDWPDQDGASGRDAGVDLLDKLGDGDAGFDFTRLSNAGAVLDGAAAPGDGPQDWGCTRDNVTGLLWHTGTIDAIDWAEAHRAAQALNASAACGASDWRLPEPGELQGLVHYGKHAPAVDEDFFPATTPHFYWTSQPDSSAPDRRAWAVNFNGGFVNAIRLATPAHVRLVSGHVSTSTRVEDQIRALAATRTHRWLEADDGTIIDRRTGLAWDRCSIGQDGPDCSGSVKVYGWQEALALVQQRNAENWRGHDNWRLANVKELTSLLDYANRPANGRPAHASRLVGPAALLNQREAMTENRAFPATLDTGYWSSTTYGHVPRMAWTVFFGSGNVFGMSKASHGAVRLVRDSTAGELARARGIDTPAAALAKHAAPNRAAKQPPRPASAQASDPPAALPMVRIFTDDGAPIRGREKTDYVGAVLTIESDDPEWQFEGRMQIKGRGNSTWQAPKKPYRIKLDSKASLLGMPSNKNWALLANYYDKSLLRTRLMLRFGEQLGMAWTSKNRAVEVELNGDYLGAYQLVETIRIGKNRVNIVEMDPGDIAEPEVTGGYMFEIDRRRNCDAPELQFDTAQGIPICIEDPGPDDIVPEQIAWLHNHVQQAEDVLYGEQFDDPWLGHAAWFDRESFIHWYLVNELSSNVDARDFSSIWNYKDRGGRIVRGPLWDFDLSAGNGASAHCGTCNNPRGFWVRPGYWYARMFQDPAFAAAVRARWDTVKVPLLANLDASIDAEVDAMGGAAERNFERWPVLDVDAHERYNVVVTGSHEGDVAWLKDWLAQRITWLDGNL